MRLENGKPCSLVSLVGQRRFDQLLQINSMRSKILMIVQSFYDKDPRVQREAEALVDHGYHVDVIALSHNHHRPIDQLHGVRVYQIPIKKRRGSVIRYFFEYVVFLMMSFGLASYLHLRRNYQICYVHNMPDFLVFATLIPRLFGAKVIIDIHDPMLELFSILYPNKSWLIKLIKFQERISLRFADQIITTTEFIKLKLIQRGTNQNKIVVIMNLPDPRLFQGPSPQAEIDANRSGFVLLFAGTISKRNGLGTVIAAMPQIKDKIPDVQFRIIGSGDHIQDLQQAVFKSQLYPWVKFESPLPLSQMPAEISRADAVIWLPPRNEFSDIVMSTKTLEALVMGKPVITVRTACHEHYFKDADVIYVDPEKSETIVTAVVELYQDHRKRWQFVQNSSSIARRFSWEREKQRYLELIDQLNRNSNYRQTRSSLITSTKTEQRQ